MSIGEAGEAEPVENRDRGQATDADLMDGETEGDTVVIAGQPEVLSTQAMQVRETAVCGTVLSVDEYENPLPAEQCLLFICACRWRMSWWI